MKFKNLHLITTITLLSTSINAFSEPSQSVDLSVSGILKSAFGGDPIVAGVLLILVAMSITTWALVFTKWSYLKKVTSNHETFINAFWKNRTLKDLEDFHRRLKEFPSTPVSGIFHSAFKELMKSTELQEQHQDLRLVLESSTNNLSRSMLKSRSEQKRQLDRYMHILAISASAGPFIGLFGTVWGIMRAFDGIAKTGSASLAAVAPGISEALIATAFGLAAAIPAVIAYNFFSTKIKNIVIGMDGFSHDFLNLSERYLLKNSSQSSQNGEI